MGSLRCELKYTAGAESFALFHFNFRPHVYIFGLNLERSLCSSALTPLLACILCQYWLHGCIVY